MIRSGKGFIYFATILFSLTVASVSPHAEVIHDMRSLMTRYKDVGRVEEVNKATRTIKISGTVFDLAAGTTILRGYNKRQTYTIDAIGVGMQVGYKLKRNHKNIITEIWVMPE